MLTAYILVLTLLVTVTTADFTCLCNYNFELNVYPDTKNGSTEIGKLFEFDCKPTYQTTQVQGWQAIQYEHKVGFVSTVTQTMIQTCNGNFPISDKVPTTTRSGTPATTNLVMTPTTLVSSTSATAAQATTSTAPNTSSTTLTVLTSTPTLHLITTTTKVSTSKSFKNLTTTSSKTTVETVQTANTTALPIISVASPIATTTTTTITTPSSTPITTTITTTPATAFTTQTTSTATPTTIRPTITPKTSSIATPTTTPTISPTTTPMTTTSTTQIATSTTMTTNKPTLTSSTTTTTTPITTSTTTPTTSPTTNQSTTTTKTPTMTPPPIPSTTSTILHTSTSNKYLCPFGVLMRIPLQYIIQHANYCYQLYPYQTKDWMTAESYCQSHNGSLVVISQIDIQTALMHLLLQLNYHHPVWIGLHDMRTEGTWEWTDGTLLSDSFYENWRPGHANRVYHNEEDCAILDPRTGRWDEVVCKGFLLDQQRHPWICQYKIS